MNCYNVPVCEASCFLYTSSAISLQTLNDCGLFVIVEEFSSVVHEAEAEKK